MTEYWVKVKWTEKPQDLFGQSTDDFADVSLLGNDLAVMSANNKRDRRRDCWPQSGAELDSDRDGRLQ